MKRTAGELAEYLKVKIEGDARTPISGVASPENARAEDLIYVASPRHQERSEESAARCALAPPGTRLKQKTILEASDPKFAFAKAAAWLLPKMALRAGVHETAEVAPSAKLAASVLVGPFVVVEEEAEIGAGTVLDAFCFVGRSARLGEKCWLHPRVTLYPGARLGNRVEVHSGVVIGGDGFGYVF
jgi:UDP-3-O-[3-hydroxymyristoyl] glucosamine N-acyltransferase